MKRILSGLFLTAVLVSGVGAYADPRYLSEGNYWGSNFPGVTTGSPIPLSVDSSGNLNVDVQVGGGSGSSVTITNPTSSPIPVLGDRLFQVAGGFSRPANTTTYTANSIVTNNSGVFPTFTIGTSAANTVVDIETAMIFSNNFSASTKATFALVCGSSSTPFNLSSYNDGTLFSPGNLAGGGLVYINTFSTTFPFGGAFYAYISSPGNYYIPADSNGRVYCDPIVTNAYVPASGETINIDIGGVY